MHRTVTITVSPEATDGLIRGLQELSGVVGLSVHRGASVKPAAGPVHRVPRPERRARPGR